MEAWFWIIGWFLSILTMTGNGFIVFLVCRRRQLRTKTNAFVVSLAVADFCVGMSAVPTLFFCEMARGCNSKGVLSNGIDYIRWMFVFASMGSLCSLVLDRYIAVVKPLKYLTFMKRRRVIQMISLSWAIPIALLMLVSSLWFSLKIPVIITMSGILSLCLEILECAIVIFCFTTMVAVVYKHEKSTRILNEQLRFNHRVLLKPQRKSAVKMMGIIISLFLLCNAIFFPL
ncbi:hypothetical protein ACROYT_G033766 [Oculina patagonica]